MGFFSSVGKALKKVVKVAAPVAAIGAAVVTGGAAIPAIIGIGGKVIGGISGAVSGVAKVADSALGGLQQTVNTASDTIGAARGEVHTVQAGVIGMQAGSGLFSGISKYMPLIVGGGVVLLLFGGKR